MATADASRTLSLQIGADNAEAVEALIDAKLQERSEDFEALRQEFLALREQVGDVPELRRQLSAAGQLLRDAIDEHNGLVDRRNSGEPVSQDEIAEDGERVERVSTDLGSVRDELEQRVIVIEQRLDDPATGLAALHDRDANLQEQIDELRGAQTNVSTSGSKSGLTAALITFAAVFILAWVIIMLTPRHESWLWAVAWGAVLGGLVGLFVGLASKEGTRTNAYLGAIRDVRRERRDRVVEQEVEETPEHRHMAERERVSA